MLTLSTNFVPGFCDVGCEDIGDSELIDDEEARDEDDSVTIDGDMDDTDSVWLYSDSDTLVDDSDTDYAAPDGWLDMVWTPVDLVSQPCAVWADNFLDTYLRMPGLRELRFLHGTSLESAALPHDSCQLVRFTQRCVTDARTSKTDYMIRYLGTVEEGPELDGCCSRYLSSIVFENGLRPLGLRLAGQVM